LGRDLKGPGWEETRRVPLKGGNIRLSYFTGEEKEGRGGGKEKRAIHPLAPGSKKDLVGTTGGNQATFPMPQTWAVGPSIGDFRRKK